MRGSKRYLLFPPSASQHLYPVRQPFGGFYSEAPAAALIPGSSEAAAFPDVQKVSFDSVHVCSAFGIGIQIWRPQSPVLTLHCRGVTQATVFEITVHAGDALYLPTCWWHAVTGGKGPNISFIHWYVPAPISAWRRNRQLVPVEYCVRLCIAAQVLSARGQSRSRGVEEACRPHA